jgi:hypothetical protein
MGVNQPPGRPPSAAMSGWEVVDQVQTTDLGADGRPARGMRVTFRSGRGVVSSVFFKDAEYNPANVRATIAAEAAKIDQVHTLSG